MLSRLALRTLLLCAAPMAHADITVTFVEGAPKDQFIIATDEACALPPFSLTIDLTSSAAGLIFDVTDAGAGVEVFQPLTLTTGADQVTALSTLTDGDQYLSLDIASLTANSPITFTTDLDDTIDQRAITVTGAEIAGATVRLTQMDGVISADFGATAAASIPTTQCSG